MEKHSQPTQFANVFEASARLIQSADLDASSSAARFATAPGAAVRDAPFPHEQLVTGEPADCMSVPAPPPGRALDELDLRESIRVMQQRSVKMVMVITGILVGIAALFIATWLLYKDEPEAAKTPPAAAPQPRTST